MTACYVDKTVHSKKAGTLKSLEVIRGSINLCKSSMTSLVQMDLKDLCCHTFAAIPVLAVKLLISCQRSRFNLQRSEWRMRGIEVFEKHV